MLQYWLLKTEPGTYSFDQLSRDSSTHWNDVRNFQARNNLRKMTRDDLALIYHSGDEKAVVGIARVIREAYPDLDPEGGDWSQVDVQFVEKFKHPVTLAEIKRTESLQEIALIKQSRLSVMPITSAHYETLLKLGGGS